MIERLTTWALEITFEIVLLAVFLALLAHDPNEFMKAVFGHGAGILMMFFVTGYLFTTIIARALWNGKRLWSYPCTAVILFVFHFEILSMAVGGAFDTATRFRIRIAGVLVALVCTSLGSFVLAKWSDQTSQTLEAELRVISTVRQSRPPPHAARSGKALNTPLRFVHPDGLAVCGAGAVSRSPSLGPVRRSRLRTVCLTSG